MQEEPNTSHGKREQRQMQRPMQIQNLLKPTDKHWPCFNFALSNKFFFNLFETVIFIVAELYHWFQFFLPFFLAMIVCDN